MSEPYEDGFYWARPKYDGAPWTVVHVTKCDCRKCKGAITVRMMGDECVFPGHAFDWCMTRLEGPYDGVKQ